MEYIIYNSMTVGFRSTYKDLVKGIISRPVLFSNNKNALLCFSSYSIILGGSSGRQIYIKENKREMDC
jgi:hypothetical protein